MATVISVSDLRTRLRHVLNEVTYQQAEHIIEKFGEPAAAIISIEEYHLLQIAKQQQTIATDQEATEPMSH